MINELRPSYEYMQPFKFIGKLLLERGLNTELHKYDNFEIEPLNVLSPNLYFNFINLFSTGNLIEKVAVRFWVEPSEEKLFTSQELSYLR